MAGVSDDPKDLHADDAAWGKQSSLPCAYVRQHVDVTPIASRKSCTDARIQIQAKRA